MGQSASTSSKEAAPVTATVFGALLVQRARKRLAAQAAQRHDPSVQPAEQVGVWTGAEWAESLGLAQIVAAALKLPRPPEQHAYVKGLRKEDCERLLREAKLEGLVDAVWTGVCSLQSQDASTGAALNDKFATEASHEMAYGGLEMFYGGIEGLIGPPMMLGGSLRLSMKAEHCEQDDSKAPFETSNGAKGATSINEWEFVNEPRLPRDKVEERVTR